jgi:hypothetical protein
VLAFVCVFTYPAGWEICSDTPEPMRTRSLAVLVFLCPTTSSLRLPGANAPLSRRAALFGGGSSLLALPAASHAIFESQEQLALTRLATCARRAAPRARAPARGARVPHTPPAPRALPSPARSPSCVGL